MNYKKTIIDIEEIINTWSVKLLVESREYFQNKLEKLEWSLKITQDAYEKIKEENTSLHKENAVLKERQKSNLIFDIIKLITSVFIWYFGNAIYNDYSNTNLTLLIGCIIVVIIIMLIQHLINK